MNKRMTNTRDIQSKEKRTLGGEICNLQIKSVRFGSVSLGLTCLSLLTGSHKPSFLSLLLIIPTPN